MNSVKITPGRKKLARRGYHHGDLRAQLIAAAEEIVLERGVDGFTLREAARRVGVSPAAPAHHFKDAKGLLSEVALLGFREFGRLLEKADRRGGSDPGQRLYEQGLAYVGFALKNPARFQLMFRHDKFDRSNAELVRVADHSFGVLEGAIRAATATKPGQSLAPETHGLLIAVWSMVHGFSHLALGGELDAAANQRGGKNMILGSLLPLMLKHLPKSV